MNKRKLMLVAVSLCMVAILGFGGTLAYLTDKDHQVNTFVTGHVYINLDEAVVEKDDNSDSETYGDFIATGDRTEENQKYEKVFPGNDILKDPTITLHKESEDAWIAAKIVINGKGLHTLLNTELNPNGLDITKKFDGVSFITGGLADIAGDYMLEGYHGIQGFFKCGESYYSYQEADATKGEWVIYMYMMNPTKNTDEPIVLFDTIHIPTAWDNEEIKIINNMTVDVTAYAVQADGFADCFTAMAKAFPTDFPVGNVQ